MTGFELLLLNSIASYPELKVELFPSRIIAPLTFPSVPLMFKSSNVQNVSLTIRELLVPLFTERRMGPFEVVLRVSELAADTSLLPDWSDIFM
jgi:hypothetical protein